MIDAARATAVLADTWTMHDVGTGWWVVMMLGMVLFWGAVIAIGVWLARSAPDRRSTSGHLSAREVLDQRLAEGEISVEEYERSRAVLDGEASAPSTGAGSS